MTSHRYPWAEAGQMTLGALADALDALPPTLMIPALCAPHSYRGIYEHIAFEQGAPSPARDVAALVRAQIGKEFTAYKGGTYRMDADTPVHVASWGSEGRAIMGLDTEGRAILAPDEEPAPEDLFDDLPDTSGITADAIRRVTAMLTAMLTPADAGEAKWREIITLTAAQIDALGRYYNNPSPGVVATYTEAVRLCLPPLVAGTRHFESRDPHNGLHAHPTGNGGACLAARCTLTQSLRAMEAAQWLLGCVETHTP